MVMYSKANILVVDDDKLLRDVVCLMLSTMGCVAIPAQDATEALDRMKNIGSFHLVLTDINMPQMDGWETLRLIRADEALAKIRLYLRLAARWGWLSAGQYEHVAAMVAEIGRLLGGWRKVTR